MYTLQHWEGQKTSGYCRNDTMPGIAGKGLCAYRNAGGEPGKGIHALRIPGVDLAAVDVLGTLVIALVVAYAFRIRGWRIGIVVCAAFALGVVAHAVFCVDTRLNRAIASILLP